MPIGHPVAQVVRPTGLLMSGGVTGRSHTCVLTDLSGLNTPAKPASASSTR